MGDDKPFLLICSFLVKKYKRVIPIKHNITLDIFMIYLGFLGFYEILNMTNIRFV